MKPVTVLHIIGGGEFGGAEKHILNLAAGLNPEEVNFKLCTLYEEPFYRVARNAGVQAWKLPTHGKLDFAVLQRLVKLIEEQHIDVVHTHGVRANLLGRLAGRITNRPVVTTIHSLMRMDYPNKLKRLVFTSIEKFTSILTNRFITVSEDLKNAVVEQGISPKKVSVIYNGIDFTPYDQRLEDKDEHAVPTVGVIGRLHPVKGQQYFLEAAAQVLADRPDAQFVLAGAGSDQARLEELVKRLGIEQQVKFLGFVDDVPQLLTTLDLVVVPSLAEGFGLVAVEALALEVPVVATRVGGLPEIIEDHVTGLLVNPTDTAALAKSILWMLNHPNEAEDMTIKGSIFVRQHFSAEAMAERTKRLYLEVADQHV